MRRFSIGHLRLSFLCLVAVIALATSVQTAAAEQTSIQVNITYPIRYVPTKADFGMPHTLKSAYPVKSGQLICTDRALDECMVNHMPLLLQTNYALFTSLVSYSSKYIVESGPNKGKIIWLEPQFTPPIGPTPYAPSAFATQIMDVGCYVTSLTTVESAVLENLPAGVHPSRRAQTFNRVPPNDLVAGPKALNQQEWQYQRWADKLQPNKENPKQPSSPDFLELAEFASDLGPKASETQITPSTINANGIKNGLKSGTDYVIEYERFDVKAAKPDDQSKIKLTLTYASAHKVAFAGFQPGKYPLLIDDVGNGKRYRVRLTSDISSIPIQEQHGSSTTTLPASKLVVANPPWAKPVFLVYQGQDGAVINNGGEIFAIQVYDSIHVTR